MLMAKAKKTGNESEQTTKEISRVFYVRLPEELLARLEKYIECQRFRPSKQMIVEALIEDMLKQEGY